MNNKIIVFVKNTLRGRVKTRLAKDVGEEKALSIYKQLIAYTRSQLIGLDCIKEVSYAFHLEENDRVWDDSTFLKTVQSGVDLGNRMSHAFREALTKEGMVRVILIGSDCAELTSEIIENAFKQLQDHEVVIGPASDGGYYLIGMSTYIPELFKDIEWSSEKVFEQTRSRVQEAGASFFILPTLNDVDELSDWERVKDKMGL